MTRYAIGDVQGCYQELRELLQRLKFSSDRDQLWLVGDLVNRGPASLRTLRFVRALGENAVVVLGNHDLHLLAVARGVRKKRRSDTLDDVLDAPDRDALLEWLITRPLAYQDGTAAHGKPADLMVHAGLVPQWTVKQALDLARAVERSLKEDPDAVFAHMYGDEPHRWSDSLTGMDRMRFVINVLTRIRVCTADGRMDLQMKGPPSPDSAYQPWFDAPGRQSRRARVIFGHWSTLGLVRRDGVLGLDSGCVWGGHLTACNLDDEEPVISTPCTGYQAVEA